MRLRYTATFIIDITTTVITKNRYVSLDEPYNTSNMPVELSNKCDIVLFIFDAPSLLSKYRRRDIIEAIYLTNTYSLYYKFISPDEYQLIRYNYGAEIPINIMLQLIDKYPEYLI